MLPAAELTAKVRDYEQFANDVLKVDLQKTTAQRAAHQAEIEELEELRRNVQHLMEQQQVSERMKKQQAMTAVDEKAAVRTASDGTTAGEDGT
jgi:hypothetical protein